MGIMMGVLIYAGLSKAKIFGDEMGGGKGGINAALAIIFTLIVVKFMPFTYYFAIAILLICMVVIFSFWIVFGAILKPVSDADENKKSYVTGVIIGIILVVLGWVLYNVTDYFASLGARGSTLAPAVMIGGVVGFFGVLFVIAGTGGVVWKSAGAGTFAEGAKRALGIEEAGEEAAGAKKAKYWIDEEKAYSREVKGLFAETIRLMQAGDTTAAFKEAKKIREIFKKKKKELKKAMADTEKQLKVIRKMSKQARQDAGIKKEKVEESIEQLEIFIGKLEGYADVLLLKEGQGLEQVITLIHNKQKPAALLALNEIAANYNVLEAEEVKLSGVNERILQLDALLRQTVGAPAGGAGGVIQF
jgi:hypothetical protein